MSARRVILRTRCGCEREFSSSDGTYGETIVVLLTPARGVVNSGDMWPKLRMGMTTSEMADARREYDERVWGKPERRTFRLRHVRDGVATYIEVDE